MGSLRLLHANDQRGIHPASWYQDGCSAPSYTPLERHIDVDVCIVGGGFTGLSAARELACRGISVAVLEAHRVGWGASGRNGGQLGSGFNQSQEELEAQHGLQRAHQLWELAEAAKADIKSLQNERSTDFHYTPGIVSALHRKRMLPALQRNVKKLQRDYQYDCIEMLDANQFRQRVNTENYHGGAIDHGAAHLHPLKLCQAIAESATAAGASIHELSEVIRIDKIPRTSRIRAVCTAGSVQASTLLLAGNGYLDLEYPRTGRNAVDDNIMPINNFIIVTEPLGKLAEELLPFNNAVSDSRFVVNYFRRLNDSRLLFGGGENYSYRFPKNLQQNSRRAMTRVFPALENTRIDYAWGGTLAITRSRLPYVRQLSSSVYAAGGYSGHGVGLACICGKVVAEAISGDTQRFTWLSEIPSKPFPGGVASRPALLAGAMIGYSWLDRI